MFSRPDCRSISTEPPPARPVLPPYPTPVRFRRRPGVPLGQKVQQAVIRGAAGAVYGMLAGCFVGLALGAASGVLYLLAVLLSGGAGEGWRALGYLPLWSLLAALIGAAFGSLPGLFIGGAVGGVAAVLRAARFGPMVGAALGAALGPVLLAGAPWELPFAQLLVVVSGALGGFCVAAIVREETQHLR